MQTDWDLIRSMMATAIDACEAIETMAYEEAHRDIAIDVGRDRVTVFDYMVSAWTFPESLRYQIIRERHDVGTDLPYVPEFARIIVAMAQASAELIGAKESAPAQAALQQMMAWYRDHALPGLERAITGSAPRPHATP